MQRSIVSELYEGRLRSVLTLQKQKPSITLQPFLLLPLDIQVFLRHKVVTDVHQHDSVESVNGALEHLLTAERVSEVANDKAVKV